MSSGCNTGGGERWETHLLKTLFENAPNTIQCGDSGSHGEQCEQIVAGRADANSSTMIRDGQTV